MWLLPLGNRNGMTKRFKVISQKQRFDAKGVKFNKSGYACHFETALWVFHWITGQQEISSAISCVILFYFFFWHSGGLIVDI